MNNTNDINIINVHSIFKHYKRRSKYYSKRGRIWFCYSILAIIISALFLLGIYFLTLHIPDTNNFKYYFYLLALLFCVIILIMFFYLNFTLKMIISSYHLTRTYREKADIIKTLQNFCDIDNLDNTAKISILKKLIFNNIDIGILPDSALLFINPTNNPKRK